MWNAWGVCWGDSWGESWGPLHEVEERPRGGGMAPERRKKIIIPARLKTRPSRPIRPSLTFAFPSVGRDNDEALYLCGLL